MSSGRLGAAVAAFLCFGAATGAVRAAPDAEAPNATPPATTPGATTPATAGTAALPESTESGRRPANAGRKPVLPQAHPLQVRAAAQPGEVTLGEPIVWTIAVDHDPRDTYSLPDKLNVAPLVLVGAPTTQRKDAAGRTTTTFRITLADVKSLAPKIADISLRVEGPDGERALSVPGGTLKFHSLLDAEGQGSREHAHHGPKPPVAVMMRSYLWLWLLLGIAATVATAMLLRRLIARRRHAEAAPRPALPADEDALARLAALKAQPPGRAAIFSLSEIVRGYLGRRLDFNALDLTSDELLERLRQCRLRGLEVRAFEDAVRWQDLVKFAKVEPLPDECRKSIAEAEDLVRRTRPQAEPSPVQRGAA